MALPHLTGSYFDTLDDKLALLQARVADLEGLTPETLAARLEAAEDDIADLKAWRAAKSDAILSIELLGSPSYVSILGIDVLGSSAAGTFWAKLNEVIGKVNSLITMSRSRELIAT